MFHKLKYVLLNYLKTHNAFQNTIIAIPTQGRKNLRNLLASLHVIRILRTACDPLKFRLLFFWILLCRLLNILILLFGICTLLLKSISLFRTWSREETFTWQGTSSGIIHRQIGRFCTNDGFYFCIFLMILYIVFCLFLFHGDIFILKIYFFIFFWGLEL